MAGLPLLPLRPHVVSFIQYLIPPPPTNYNHDNTPETPFLILFTARPASARPIPRAPANATWPNVLLRYDLGFSHFSPFSHFSHFSHLM